jgi:hypothetical protein
MFQNLEQPKHLKTPLNKGSRKITKTDAVVASVFVIIHNTKNMISFIASHSNIFFLFLFLGGSVLLAITVLHLPH